MGHHNQALNAFIADAQRLAGLQLTFDHGQQPATVDLGDIRRFTEHQRDKPGAVGVGQHHAGGRKHLRQVVDKNQQDQQRQAAKEPDIQACGITQPAALRLSGQSQKEAEDDPQHPGFQAQFNHRRDGPPEVTVPQQAQGVVPIELHVLAPNVCDRCAGREALGNPLPVTPHGVFQLPNAVLIS